MNNILKIRDAKSIASKLLMVCCAMFFCIAASNAQISVSAVNTDPYCIGTSTGSIKLTASGGTSPYTFQMMSPSVGAINSDPSTYTYAGLAAGTYQFKVVDFNGNIQSRTIVLANPAPVSYNFVTPFQKMLVCDSIDVSPYQYTIGTARPKYKLEVWVNSSVAIGTPTMTFNSIPAFSTGNLYWRDPLANFNTNSVMRVTDSCGNVSNVQAFVSANITYGAVPSKSVCNATDIEVLFNGLLAPATFNLYAGSTASGSPLQTITQNIVKQSTSNANYQTGGVFVNVPTGTYTITGTDACGKTYTRTFGFSPITKNIPSAAASNACMQTTVDSTTSFRVGSSTWSTPYTFTIVSGPNSYVHTNTAGVLNTSISYPMSITSSNKSYIEISNMPMGTYRIAVLDSCGWTDTVTYVVDASNIAKISMTGTVTPGCLNANSLTVNVKDGCSRPEQSVHLLNSSGADLGSSGLTSNNTSFTVNNLPAGNYYFALYGISTGAFANGGTSILQHVTTPVSMKVPFTINPYVQPSVSGV